MIGLNFKAIGISIITPDKMTYQSEIVESLMDRVHSLAFKYGKALIKDEFDRSTRQYGDLIGYSFYHTGNDGTVHLHSIIQRRDNPDFTGYIRGVQEAEVLTSLLDREDLLHSRLEDHRVKSSVNPFSSYDADTASEVGGILALLNQGKNLLEIQGYFDDWNWDRTIEARAVLSFLNYVR